MLMMMALMYWLARSARRLTGLALGDMLQRAATRIASARRDHRPASARPAGAAPISAAMPTTRRTLLRASAAPAAGAAPAPRARSTSPAGAGRAHRQRPRADAERRHASPTSTWRCSSAAADQLHDRARRGTRSRASSPARCCATCSPPPARSGTHAARGRAQRLPRSTSRSTTRAPRRHRRPPARRQADDGARQGPAVRHLPVRRAGPSCATPSTTAARHGSCRTIEVR